MHIDLGSSCPTDIAKTRFFPDLIPKINSNHARFEPLSSQNTSKHQQLLRLHTMNTILRHQFARWGHSVAAWPNRQPVHRSLQLGVLVVSLSASTMTSTPKTARMFWTNSDADSDNAESETPKKGSPSSSSPEQDLASLPVLLEKLTNVAEAIQEQLPDQHQDLVHPWFATLRLIHHWREQNPEGRAKVYEQSGRPGTAQDLVTQPPQHKLQLLPKELDFDGLPQLTNTNQQLHLSTGLEWADLAYETDTAALKQALKEDHGFHLVRHDPTASTGYLGHYVAIDKVNKVALVGIRGTSTLEEVLTDCCGNAVSFTVGNNDKSSEKAGDSQSITCHEGIFYASRGLARDIEELSEELIWPAGYRLVLVGHSLGAAGAALVGFLLQQSNKECPFTDLRQNTQVLAYACPPILDYASAKACAPFCTTVVNNSDLIPRASLSNLTISMKALQGVQKKMAALHKDFLMDVNTWLQLMPSSESGDEQKSKKKDALFMNLEEYLGILSQAADSVLLEDSLVVPGKVLILYDDWNSSTSSQGAIGFVVSPDGNTPVLRGVDWNERMISDHTVEAYRTSLAAAQALHEND